MISPWVAEELETIDLGDKRRNERLAKLVSAMTARPSKSIPASVNGGHNETTAAYRLFDNEALDFDRGLLPNAQIGDTH